VNRLRDLAETAWQRVALALLAVGFFAAYLLLDLREGGRASSLATTRLSTPSFYVAHFGAWFFWGCVLIDALLAVATAVLVIGSLSLHRSRKAAAGGFCTGTATLVFGFAVFGCPGCVMPLFGTLGLALFASSLPLFGLEFKLLSVAVTLGAIAWLARQLTRQRHLRPPHAAA
jgi:uncharacterized membrane protein YidH (DUF202 family)